MGSQNKAPSQVAPQFNVRMPVGMREKIKERAENNERSMNAEMIFLLKKAMEPVNDSSPPA